MVSDRVVRRLNEFRNEMDQTGHYPLHRCRHVAGLTLSGSLDRMAVNMLKTHPWLTKYTSHPFLHAESHVIIRRGTERCNGWELVSLRFTSDNELTMSYPCSACWSMIKDVGIRRVYYSDWDGVIRETKLDGERGGC